MITEIIGKRKKCNEKRWKEGKRWNRVDEMISRGNWLSICDRRRVKDRRRVIKAARTSKNRNKVVKNIVWLACCWLMYRKNLLNSLLALVRLGKVGIKSWGASTSLGKISNTWHRFSGKIFGFQWWISPRIGGKEVIWKRTIFRLRHAIFGASFRVSYSTKSLLRRLLWERVSNCSKRNELARR